MISDKYSPCSLQNFRKRQFREWFSSDWEVYKAKRLLMIRNNGQKLTFDYPKYFLIALNVAAHKREKGKEKGVKMG